MPAEAEGSRVPRVAQSGAWGGATLNRGTPRQQPRGVLLYTHASHPLQELESRYARLGEPGSDDSSPRPLLNAHNWTNGKCSIFSTKPIELRVFGSIVAPACWVDWNREEVQLINAERKSLELFLSPVCGPPNHDSTRLLARVAACER